MSTSKKVTAGKYYVNNARRIARKVVKVQNNIVFFINYHKDTGRSNGVPNECPKEHFTKWAEREATLTETTSLQHEKMYAF